MVTVAVLTGCSFQITLANMLGMITIGTAVIDVLMTILSDLLHIDGKLSASLRIDRLVGEAPYPLLLVAIRAAQCRVLLSIDHLLTVHGGDQIVGVDLQVDRIAGGQ